MAEKGRYLKALGLESTREPAKTDLTPEGALVWAVSKAPAALGGKWADSVYDWANKKWPTAKRGAEFTGGICVVVGAYGLQVLVTRFQAQYGHLADKFTDGMIGRISPVIWSLFAGLFDSTKPATSTAAPKSAARTLGMPAQASVSLDGDRESVREVTSMLRDSPETTHHLANTMFEIMRQGGVNIDEEGRQAVVTSMREATAKFADGHF